eukprot:2570586-Rhodomonas_salina.2
MHMRVHSVCMCVHVCARCVRVHTQEEGVLAALSFSTSPTPPPPAPLSPSSPPAPRAHSHPLTVKREA